MITHTTNKCTNCGAEDSIATNFRAGQVECEVCGAVLEDRIIDETYEGRNFGNENQTSGKDQTRVGGPLNPYSEKSNLSVNFVSKQDMPSKKRHRLNGAESSHIKKIFQQADMFGDTLKLPTSTKNRAHNILDEVKSSGKLKGRNLKGIIAAVFYFACREESIPRKLNEISTELNLDSKLVSKCCNTIKKCLVQKPEDLNNTVMNFIMTCCNKLSRKYGGSIKNFVDLRKLSREICETICKKEIIAGRNPSTIAGASVLIASKLLEMQIGKKEIADESSTTENTILNAYNKLMNYKKHIIPEKYIEKIHLLTKN